MKKLILLAAAVALVAGLYAAQDAELSIRQVRDPVQLREKLNANATDAEARISAVSNNVVSLQAAAAANLYVIHTTQLVYIAGSVTNTIDADITH